MIDVLFFSQLQKQIGIERLEIDFANRTVKELKEILQKDFLLQELNKVMVAVNEEFVSEDTVVNEGDTVVFFPQLIGGR